MRSYEKFAARVDNSSLQDLTVSELRTRLDLLEAELSQLAHDEIHVRAECYGMELFHHLRIIAKDQLSARAKKARYSVELSGRGV